MPRLGEFLIDRIDPLVNHVFGIPGDYVLNLYSQLADGIGIVNTTDEQCAGFAADAYARVNGFGVVCATYCVGGFKLLNSIAGAYAERSPVLFISGAPGVKERNTGLVLHHCTGPYECQKRVFENVTCASAILDDPSWACHEIDRVIDAMQHHKLPGYIEVPRDMVDRNVRYDVYEQGTPDASGSDPENLEEALEKSIEWIDSSKRPVILAGVELARFGFGHPLIQFAERHNIPVATTLLSKSVISESHRLSLGIYCGSMSYPHVRDLVENSDCVIMLGVMQTDMNMAFQPFKCNQTNVIMANAGRVRVRRSTYEDVEFSQFTHNLLQANVSSKKDLIATPTARPPYVAQSDTIITSARLFEQIDSILDEDMAIIADIGDSLFGACDLKVHHSNQFLSPAFYTSMGFAVPAALGLQCAQPEVRPIVIVGDGAFQMTGMEFSTIIKRNLNPIVFVLNNQGYETERHLGYDGEINDVQMWNYHLIPKVVGGGNGYLATTEIELQRAVCEALGDKKSASIINVVVDTMNPTPALRRMTKSLSDNV